MNKTIKIALGSIYLIILISFLYFLFTKFDISRIDDFSYYKLIQSNIDKLIGKNLILNIFLFFLFTIFWVMLLGFGSPILLFIHGGYWKAFDKNMFQFIAERFVDKGACVVLNNYDLCPAVTMNEIISQNRSALKWIYKNAKKIGGDPGRIHVTGHSAGGHLTAMLMATNWKQYDLPFDVINGAVPISGLFDLEPLRISYLNADLHMTKEECVDVSPVHNLPKFMPPTVVAVGGGETDEFRRQSRIYTDKCREHGFEVSYLEVENHDHVNVVGELRNLNSPLTSALMYQMGL